MYYDTETHTPTLPRKKGRCGGEEKKESNPECVYRVQRVDTGSHGGDEAVRVSLHVINMEGSPHTHTYL